MNRQLCPVPPMALFAFLIIVPLSSAPSAWAQIDLNNVVEGDVIDNTTPIPDGATINLNGGAIAPGTVFGPDELPNGVTLNVNSGTVGIDVEIQNSTININGGEVALAATNLAEGLNNIDNTITVNGGEVGSFFQLRGNTTLELIEGSVEAFGIINDATATVRGGSFNLSDVNGPLDIFGGDFNTFRVFGTGSVNLFGSEFAIDGVPIDELVLGETFEINDRNVLLSGTLSDGSTFSNFLDSETPIGSLNFSPEFGEVLPGFAATSATVTVTLVNAVAVPEPSSFALLAAIGFGRMLRRRRSSVTSL